jgi:hypothetical protein
MLLCILHRVGKEVLIGRSIGQFYSRSVTQIFHIIMRNTYNSWNSYFVMILYSELCYRRVLGCLFINGIRWSLIG